MNILLVDDSPSVFPYIHGIIVETHREWNVDFADSYEAAVSMLQATIYDLFILDYELNTDNQAENGLNLGLYIKSRKEYKYTPVIFETSFSEYIFDAVNKLNCIYYLTKPFSKENLLEMLNKIANVPDTRKGILLRDLADIDFYVYLDEIVYIESFGHHLTVYTIDETIEMKRYSFKNFNEPYFFKCHKSYMVNWNYVIAYDPGLSELTIRNPKNHKTQNITVGRTFKKQADERMKNR